MRMEKEFEHCGLKCMVVIQNMGHRCGYVGVDKTHPLYDADYTEVADFEVHGGLTFSNNIGSDNLWYFGYDCSHLDDACDIDAIQDTQLREIMRTIEQVGEVRSLEYCINECKSLAEQLKGVTE